MKYRSHSHLKESLRKHIMAWGAPKEWGFMHKIDRTNVNTMVNRMGIKKHYITDEELQHLHERRKQAEVAQSHTTPIG